MLRRIIVLAAVIGSLAVVPTSSAAVQSFTTTLDAHIVSSDGNCCGFVFETTGRVGRHDIPGVRAGTFTANLFHGAFQPEPDPAFSNPSWIDFIYTARGGKGTLRLSTAFPRDNAHSFTWVVREGTGRYAGWTGSGTYSEEVLPDAPSDPEGTVSLTLAGEIGPS